MKITIITGQHLVSNPRVWKEANALSKYGYNVSIYSTWYSNEHLIADKKLIDDSVLYLPAISLIKSKQRLHIILYAKLVKKIATIIFTLFQLDSIFQVLYLPYHQLKKIKESKPDLYICHQEAGLLIGKELLKLGYKVAFDFEDWYSEDYLKRDRPTRLLRKAEIEALQHAIFVTCPSESLFKNFSLRYKVKVPIKVIYNSFPDMISRDNEENKISNSLVWFSQTIGPNRGLEPFINALKILKLPLEIHLIGNSTIKFQKQLLRLTEGTSHIIKFHAIMSHEELMKLLPCFEIGLALETNCSESRVYTITNKILTYLQLNLTVIATDTIGHLELQNDFKQSITYISLNNQYELVQKLNSIFLNKKEKGSESIPYKYTWSAQQETIRSLVGKSVFA